MTKKLLFKIAFITLVVALLAISVIFAAQHASGDNTNSVLPTIVVDEEITVTLGQTKTINAVLRNADGTIDEGNNLLYESANNSVLSFADETQGVFKIINSPNLPPEVMVNVVYANNAKVSAAVRVVIVVQSATLTFDYNGATSGNSAGNLTVYYGTAINGLPSPLKSNYEFTGWYTEVDGQSKKLSNGDRYPYKNDLRLTARFAASLTLDGGQGVGSVDVADTYFNEPLPALDAPVRTGYAFVGWFTAPSGGGRQYRTGDRFTEDVPTLYASWKANTYTVKYDVNGGRLGPAADNTAKTYDQSFSISDTAPKYGSYKFFGWSMDKNAAVASYKVKEVVKNLTATNGEEVVLYAIWGVELTYDANGGEGAPEPQNVTRGHEMVIPRTTPTRTGYEFLGWNTSRYAQTADYLAGVSYPLEFSSDKKLYAIWGARKYTVSYQANTPRNATSAMTGNTVDSVHYYDGNSALSLNDFKLSGYTFLWWTLKADGTGERYKGGQFVRNLPNAEKGNITMYAQWAKNDMLIMYNPNTPSRASAEANGDVEPTILSRVGASTQLPSDKFSLRGWHQIGWESSAGEFYDFEQTVGNLRPDSDNEPIYFYAVWEANTYTIEYDTVGGNVIDNQTATYDIDLYLAAAPTRKDSRFSHWVDAEGNTYLASAFVRNLTPNNNRTVTLTAVWEEPPSPTP